MTTPELADTLDRIATAIYLTHDESSSLRQAAAALRAGVPEGWKVVPVEPPGQMACAARIRYENDDDEGVVDWFAVISAAIAAAPQPPEVGND